MGCAILSWHVLACLVLYGTIADSTCSGSVQNRDLANEIWLPFTSKADGTSGDLLKNSALRAGPKAVSIVIHDPDNPAKRIGCVDLAPTDLTYAWTFDDGETSTEAAPEHTYTEAGTYTAEVTVTDGETGDTATDTVEIVVVDRVASHRNPPGKVLPGP